MTFQQYIYQVCWNAMRGLPNSATIDLDTWFPIAESLCPTIFQQVGEDAAGDERKRSLLRKNLTVTVVNGSATLTDETLTAYMEDATYLDESDLTKSYSWVRNWGDFIDPNLDFRLGYFCVKNGVVLNQREPGDVYSTSSGFTGSMLMNIPCVPVIPTNATDAIDVPDEVLNDLLDIGESTLRGQMIKSAAAQT